MTQVTSAWTPPHETGTQARKTRVFVLKTHISPDDEPVTM